MKSISIYILAVVVGLMASRAAWAQTEEEADGEVQDAEVVIEKERKIELKPQRKLYEFIKWMPEDKATTAAPKDFALYEYKEKPQDLNIEPAAIKNVGATKKYDHFAKAGFGNFGSPLLKLEATKMFDDNKTVGLGLSHKSFASGVVDDENSGNNLTTVRLNGALSNQYTRFSSSLAYRAERNFYYGYPEGTVEESGDIRHSANFVDFGLAANGIQPGSDWQYGARLNYTHYADNFNASEDMLEGQGSLGYQETFYLESKFNVSGYKDIGIDKSRNYLRLNPYYRWEQSAFTLDVGFSYSVQNDDLPDLNNQKLFPFAKVTYPINNDYSLFAKLDGGYNFNSIYQLASDVGVLNQSIALVNSERLIDLSGGIDGSPISTLSFSASVNFQSVRYLPILINNATDQSRLDVIYDPEVSKILTFTGSVRYKPVENHELSANVQLFSYSSDGYDQIYHRPTTSIVLGGQHMLLPALRANWNMSVIGGIVGRNLLLTDPNESLETISKLDIELHYQINENWGAFLSGENLLNQEYSQYLNYPQRGLQVRVGATFRL